MVHWRNLWGGKHIFLYIERLSRGDNKRRKHRSTRTSMCYGKYQKLPICLNKNAQKRSHAISYRIAGIKSWEKSQEVLAGFKKNQEKGGSKRMVETKSNCISWKVEMNYVRRWRFRHQPFSNRIARRTHQQCSACILDRMENPRKFEPGAADGSLWRELYNYSHGKCNLNILWLIHHGGSLEIRNTV